MEPGKIYLQLDGYELGQVVALLPDVAWNRMERGLKNRIREAQAEIEADRERATKPKRRKKAAPDESIQIGEYKIESGTILPDSPTPDDHVPLPEPAENENLPTQVIADENLTADNDDFFE